MPWNCLCAAKEKRKLEISAPILNIEDTHNNQLQLIPLKKQQHQQQQLQTVSYKFNEKNSKKLARHHSIETKATSASVGSTDTLDTSSTFAGAAAISQTGCTNSDNLLNGEITKDPSQQQQQQQQKDLQDTCNNNDGPIRKTSKWKRNKKNQQNNNKLTNNNNSSNQKIAKTSSKKNASNDNNLQGISSNTVLLTKNNNEENGKITKQLTNVKFSFDTKSKKDKLTKDTIATVVTADVLQKTQTTVNDKKNVQQLKCNGTSSGCNSKTLPVQLNTTPLSTTIAEKDAVQENYEKNVEIAVKNNSQNDNSHDMNKINENVNITDVEQLKNENAIGNYDEIPLIRVEKTTNAEGSSKIICSSSSSTTIGQVFEYQRTDANVVPNDIFFPLPPPPANTTTSVSAFPLDKSSESIPFIDDEDSRKHHHHHQQHNTIDSMTHKQQHSSQQQRSEDDHSTRFITLHPKNVVSHNTYAKQLEDEQAAKYLEELTTRQHEKNTGNLMIGRGESFSPPPLQYAESTVEHNFQVWKAAKGKLCQVCHGSLIVKPNSVVKCFNCDLICHNWCASSMPTIRYHDTSFVIFRKWLKAQDELAFPSVHQYIKNEGSKNSSDAPTAAVTTTTATTTTTSSLKTFGDHYLTDSECTYSNGKPFENQLNGIKQKRRRTKSLEKCEKLHNDDDTDGDEEIALIIEETVPEDYTKINKIHKKNSQDDQNNNALTSATIKLQIIELKNDTNEKDETKNDEQQDKIQKQEDNDSSISIETKENTVIADIHNSNNSTTDQVDNSNTGELLVITENEYETIKKKNTKDKSIPDDVPEEVQKNDKDEEITTTTPTPTTTTAEKQMFRISDSSDKTLTSEIRSTTDLASSSEPPLIDYKIKAQSEPSRRKNYNRTVCYSPISTISSSSMSLHTDDPDESIVEYATVDLRRPKPQIIFDKVTQSFNSKLVDSKIWLKNNETINQEMILHQQIDELLWKIEILYGRTNFLVPITKLKVNFCHFLKHIDPYPLFASIHFSIHKKSNYPNYCPWPKGNYSLIDYKFPIETLPKFTTNGNFKVTLSFLNMNDKNLFTYIVYGELINF